MMFGPDALELIKEFEKGPDGDFAPTPYRCPAGYWTVGWGHRVRPGETFPEPLDAAGADTLLRADLERIASDVTISLRNRPEVTQSMFDALVSLGFNIGVGALLNSTLISRLRLGQWKAAANQFLRWNKARNPKTGRKEPLPGLTRRRQAEQKLFLRDGFPS